MEELVNDAYLLNMLDFLYNSLSKKYDDKSQCCMCVNKKSIGYIINLNALFYINILRFYLNLFNIFRH